MAAITMSAARVIAARSREREWATVTVASPALSSTHKKEGHRFSHDHAATDHDRIGARCFDATFLKKPHAAARRAGNKPGWVIHGKLGHVDRVKTVNILGGINGGDHGRLVNVFGKRRLHEDAVDERVVIKIADERDNLGLARVGRKFVLYRVQAQFRGLLVLRPHIGARSRIVADEDNRQTRA